MVFKLVNTKTGEVLLETEEKFTVALHVDERERAFLGVNDEYITTYLSDRVRERAEIKAIRGRYGLENRMEL